MQPLTIFIYSFCYLMVFILSLISKKEGSQRLIKDDATISDKPGNIIGLHIIGIMWLGMVPWFVLKLSVLKTFTGSGIPHSSVLVIIAALLILATALAIRVGKNIQQQPANSNYINNQLPVRFLTSYFALRMVFLFSYELFFRGFLLFDSIQAMGIIPAVILNVLLHQLLHLFNSKKEMLACIPFSLLVCWLCILCNAAWPAVILHITISLLYEINLYKSHFSAAKIARL